LLVDHLGPFSAALPHSNFLVTARRIVELRLVVEDKTDKSRIHLVAETEGVADIHELFDEGWTFAEGALRRLKL
jgi:hypothetical protein